MPDDAPNGPIPFPVAADQAADQAGDQEEVVIPMSMPAPDRTKKSWIKAEKVKDHPSGRTDLYTLLFINGDEILVTYGPVEHMCVMFIANAFACGADTIGVER